MTRAWLQINRIVLNVALSVQWCLMYIAAAVQCRAMTEQGLLSVDPIGPGRGDTEDAEDHDAVQSKASPMRETKPVTHDNDKAAVNETTEGDMDIIKTVSVKDMIEKLPVEDKNAAVKTNVVKTAVKMVSFKVTIESVHFNIKEMVKKLCIEDAVETATIFEKKRASEDTDEELSSEDTDEELSTEDTDEEFSSEDTDEELEELSTKKTLNNKDMIKKLPVKVTVKKMTGDENGQKAFATDMQIDTFKNMTANENGQTAFAADMQINTFKKMTADENGQKAFAADMHIDTVKKMTADENGQTAFAMDTQFDTVKKTADENGQKAFATDMQLFVKDIVKKMTAEENDQSAFAADTQFDTVKKMTADENGQKAFATDMQLFVKDIVKKMTGDENGQKAFATDTQFDTVKKMTADENGQKAFAADTPFDTVKKTANENGQKAIAADTQIRTIKKMTADEKGQKAFAADMQIDTFKKMTADENGQKAFAADMQFDTVKKTANENGQKACALETKLFVNDTVKKMPADEKGQTASASEKTLSVKDMVKKMNTVENGIKASAIVVKKTTSNEKANGASMTSDVDHMNENELVRTSRNIVSETKSHDPADHEMCAATKTTAPTPSSEIAATTLTASSDTHIAPTLRLPQTVIDNKKGRGRVNTVLEAREIVLPPKLSTTCLRARHMRSFVNSSNIGGPKFKEGVLVQLMMPRRIPSPDFGSYACPLPPIGEWTCPRITRENPTFTAKDNTFLRTPAVFPNICHWNRPIATHTTLNHSAPILLVGGLHGDRPSVRDTLRIRFEDEVRVMEFDCRRAIGMSEVEVKGVRVVDRTAPRVEAEAKRLMNDFRTGELWDGYETEYAAENSRDEDTSFFASVVALLDREIEENHGERERSVAECAAEVEACITETSTKLDMSKDVTFQDVQDDIALEATTAAEAPISQRWSLSVIKRKCRAAVTRIFRRRRRQQ